MSKKIYTKNYETELVTVTKLDTNFYLQFEVDPSWFSLVRY